MAHRALIGPAMSHPWSWTLRFGARIAAGLRVVLLGQDGVHNGVAPGAAGEQVAQDGSFFDHPCRTHGAGRRPVEWASRSPYPVQAKFVERYDVADNPLILSILATGGEFRHRTIIPVL